MNAPLEHPVVGTSVAETSEAKLDIRHLLIGACGSHSLKANGIYQVARAIANEQLAGGQSVRVMLLREANSANPDEDSDPSLEIVMIDGPKVLGKRVGFSHAVLEALTAGASKGTIIHIHTARQPLLVPLTLALKKRGIPYAITVHGRYSHVFDEEMNVKRKLPALYLKTVEQWVLRGARFTQAVAPSEEALLRHVAPRANVQMIPNAAFSSREGAPRREGGRAAPSAKYPVFGFLGRYEIEHKGLDLLLNGFAAYKRAGGKGTLEMVGSGPLRQDLLALAGELQILDSVSISDARYGEDKIRTLAGWDFFVSPSRFDGLPMATLEAAFLGMPVLVTTETGLKETVLGAGAGLSIDGLSAEAVADALARAEKISKDDWVKMSAAAFEMARAMGDWTSIANKMVALYRKP